MDPCRRGKNLSHFVAGMPALFEAMAYGSDSSEFVPHSLSGIRFAKTGFKPGLLASAISLTGLSNTLEEEPILTINPSSLSSIVSADPVTLSSRASALMTDGK